MFFDNCFLTRRSKYQPPSIVVDPGSYVPPGKQTSFIPVEIANIDLYVPALINADNANMQQDSQDFQTNRLGIHPPPCRYNSPFEGINRVFIQTNVHIPVKDNTSIKAPEMPSVSLGLFDTSIDTTATNPYSSPTKKNQSTSRMAQMSPIIFAPHVKSTKILVQEAVERNIGCWRPQFLRGFCRTVEAPVLLRAYDPNFVDQIIVSQGKQFHRDRGIWFLAMEPDNENNSYVTFPDESADGSHIGTYSSFDSLETKDSRSPLSFLRVLEENSRFEGQE